MLYYLYLTVSLQTHRTPFPLQQQQTLHGYVIVAETMMLWFENVSVPHLVQQQTVVKQFPADIYQKPQRFPDIVLPTLASGKMCPLEV